jgi:HAD superfamily phosphatase (TIGR01668 family)
VEHVTDINLDDLKADGIKGLIFDLDNTIMAPKAGKLTEDITHWLEVVRNDFKIAIVSNNPHEHYVEEASNIIGAPAYAKAKKPGTAISAMALKNMGLLPTQVAMIGDRPLTDIWVGQRLGFITILVDPLIKHEEAALVKVLRKLERIFIEAPKKIFSHHRK